MDIKSIRHPEYKKSARVGHSGTKWVMTMMSYDKGDKYTVRNNHSEWPGSFRRHHASASDIPE